MSDAPRLEGYQPSKSERRQIWESWSLARRTRRFSDAKNRLEALRILAARETTESERAAILKRLAESSRTSLRRWQQRYTEQGFDGLIDWRVPPVAAEMPKQVEGAICTLRQADPNVAVAVIVEHVRKHHGFEVSETVVKRTLREHGLERRRGPVSNSGPEDRKLELGGMKLVEAALVETGYLEALTLAVQEHVAQATVPEESAPPESSDRDEYGRFLPSYNERYTKGEDDAIGPGFASVEDKRIGLDPRRLHLYGARYDVVEQKMLALMTSHLLGNGRWDGIRVARGALLEDLCGYAYMPATLDLFARELKYLGVSSTLWEVHARHWLEQTADWGAEREAAVLYIDATNKPVWTDLFSQSSKVSSTGRVMPALETVAFHSGYGVPLWMVTSSGRTPLVKAIPGMLDQLCEINEGAEIGRIVVIDAEGNSVPFLKGLEQGSPKRGWVTRLRPSLIEGKTIFERSRYRTYRDGDRVRTGLADLHDPESPETPFRIRVVEIKRRSKSTITYLGASTLLDEHEWGASAVADLYFARWPKQEANFRAVNQAMGLKEVHGYGKRLVDNISVVTRLDELEQKLPHEQQQLALLTEQFRSDKQLLEEQRKALAETERRHAVLERQLHARLSKGKLITPKLQQLAVSEKETAKQIRKNERLVARSDKKATLSRLRVEKQQSRVDRHLSEKQTISSRRRIYQHDVEMDSFFSLMKVGLVLTITFVLKKYLGDACMEALTFLERVATVPARLQVLPELEILTFEYNHRDPEVMALLAANCEAINARALRVRSGRTLRIQLNPAPPPARPPTGRRTKTMDRFRRK